MSWSEIQVGFHQPPRVSVRVHDDPKADAKRLILNPCVDEALAPSTGEQADGIIDCCGELVGISRILFQRDVSRNDER